MGKNTVYLVIGELQEYPRSRCGHGVDPSHGGVGLTDADLPV